MFMALKFLLEASLNSSKLKEIYKTRICVEKNCKLFILFLSAFLNFELWAKDACAHEAKNKKNKIECIIWKSVDF